MPRVAVEMQRAATIRAAAWALRWRRVTRLCIARPGEELVAAVMAVAGGLGQWR